MTSLKTIFLEEAIRTIALIGVVMFGVLPIAYLLGADVARVAIISFLAPLLVFPIMLLMRIRTGKNLKIRTRRGWYITVSIAFALSLFIAVLTFLTGYVSWSKAVVQVAASALVIAFLTWTGTRLMQLR